MPARIHGLTVTDLHVHIQPWHQLTEGARRTMEAPRKDKDGQAIARYQDDPSALVAAMDAWGVQRMALINYVAPDTLGFGHGVNDWVADHCSAHRDRLLPVGSIHPRLAGAAKDVRAEVERFASELDLAFLKLHPAHQLVWPDAYRKDSRGAAGHPPDGQPYGRTLEALYLGCIDHDLPLMVHTGTSVFPGALNAPTDPLLIDTVAVDFPKLQIIMAHAGRPLWGEAAAFVAKRHDNVWLDLSGIPPKHLARYVPDLPRLWKKCLWGTDWPGPGLPQDAPRTNVEAFLATDLGLDQEAKRAILHDNSLRLVPEGR